MLRSTLHFFAATGASLFALMAATVCVAGPVIIDYELTALAAPGRYEYRYTLTNVSLATPLSLFSVDFDTALYNESSLTITSTGLGEWSEQILGSVLANPAQYDSYKTVGAGLNTGDTETGFTVEFDWLGVGTPGNQAFTIYDPATLNVLDTGLTSAVVAPPPPPPNGVPEPSTAALALLALCGAAAGMRHSRRHCVPHAASLMGAARSA